MLLSCDLATPNFYSKIKSKKYANTLPFKIIEMHLKLTVGNTNGDRNETLGKKKKKTNNDTWRLIIIVRRHYYDNESVYVWPAGTT